MTDEQIIAKLRAAEEGTQVAFPDEATKQRAFQLLRPNCGYKQLYITTEADYQLWLQTPKAPTPGS